ncbi:MAG: MGMT family protein [archaeon]
MALVDFNKKVWQALKKIPRGKVAAYAQIAKAAKSPNSARAAGNACGKNPFAPIVPCHRVVASNGSLGGYSGGISKKIKLLAKEGITVKNNKIVNFREKLVKQKELE